MYIKPKVKTTDTRKPLISVTRCTKETKGRKLKPENRLQLPDYTL